MQVFIGLESLLHMKIEVVGQCFVFKNEKNGNLALISRLLYIVRYFFNSQRQFGQACAALVWKTVKFLQKTASKPKIPMRVNRLHQKLACRTGKAAQCVDLYRNFSVFQISAPFLIAFCKPAPKTSPPAQCPCGLNAFRYTQLPTA